MSRPSRARPSLVSRRVRPLPELLERRALPSLVGPAPAPAAEIATNRPAIVSPQLHVRPAAVPSAVVPLHFDFGTPSSPVAPGDIQVTRSTMYSPEQGYGWARKTVYNTDRQVGSDRFRDSNFGRQGIFVLDLPDGTYQVTLTLGDLTHLHDRQGIYLEWNRVGLVSTKAGQVLKKTYTATVSDGRLTLMLKDLGGQDPYFSLLALDLQAKSASSPQTSPVPYTPDQIRSAYGIDRLNLDGSGQTIAIIDAYDDPTIAEDLAVFSQRFGLPPATLVKATPQGTPDYDPGWASEIALDVEWAHSIAPRAKILLVEARSTSFSNLMAAVDYAVAQGAEQISMSWGGSEYAGELRNDVHFRHPGVSFFAAAGDQGGQALYPAVSPYVTAVGGTTLQLDNSGNSLSETAWNSGGGGHSLYVARPAYQTGFLFDPNRGSPDVAYNSDTSTGFYVYDSSSAYGGWFQVGGTSAGTPQWAALAALVNQGRADRGKPSLGSGTTYGTNEVLYAMPSTDFVDVIVGSNGYPAVPGYDLATGRGSPRANRLILDLINA